MTCILHGQCGHETDACKTLKKYPKLNQGTVRVLKHHNICVIGHGEGDMWGRCSRTDCKFDHHPQAYTETLLLDPSSTRIASGERFDSPHKTDIMRGKNVPAATRLVGPSSDGVMNPAIEAPPAFPAIEAPPPPLPLPGPYDSSLYASFGMMMGCSDEDHCSED